MRTQGSIKFSAELLAEAVTAVVPKKRKNSRKSRKPNPVSLEYLVDEEVLGVKEVYHALRGYRVRAAGKPTSNPLPVDSTLFTPLNAGLALPFLAESEEC